MVVPDLGELTGLGEALAPSMSQERWFTDKHRAVERVRISHRFWLRRDSPGLVIALARVEFAEGPPAAYQLVLALWPWDSGQDAEGGRWPVQARSSDGSVWAVGDALAEPELAQATVEGLASSGALQSGGSGKAAMRALHQGLPTPWPLPATSTSADHTHTTVLFGDQWMVKFFRRLWPGVSPEAELLEALDETGFTGIAQPLGVIEATGSDERSLGVVQRYLRNATDGFNLALTSLRDLYSDLLLDADGAVPMPDGVVRAVEEQGGSFARSATQIGELTAALHAALASLGGPERAARPFDRGDFDRIASDLVRQLDQLLDTGDERLEPLLVHESALRELADRVRRLKPEGLAIRIHGDYHLAQLLRTDGGWYVLDFEGRPALPMELRRRRMSALQDVAGMLRSFDYAATVALRQQTSREDATAATLEPYGWAWARSVRQHFLKSYLDSLSGKGVIPSDPRTVEAMLDCLEASQALYEVDYELRSRPEWVAIPLQGIARLVQLRQRPVEAQP